MYKLIYRKLTGEYCILDADKQTVYTTYSEADAQRKLCRLNSGADTIVLSNSTS